MTAPFISGWGNYPKIQAEIFSPQSIDELKNYLPHNREVIARGLGRSYGDSSLNKKIISIKKLNKFLAFDENTAVLKCEAGISLEEFCNIFVPRGWFLKVTPGTKFVTIGGAIASDVHGKNHHKDGTFCDHVLSLDLMLSSGEIIQCSNEKNSGLFYATCGGMGLTGVILRAEIKLKSVESAYIKQVSFKARNLDEVMSLFDEQDGYTYSVAWIDCLSTGKNLGRSILMLGEFASAAELENTKFARHPLRVQKNKKLNVPFSFPGFILNKFSIRAFNSLYFNKHVGNRKESIVDYNTFFYPLDNIYNWNKIYGSRGFTQYQFVLPKESSRGGLNKVLTKISSRGMGSFLAVLKLFGKQNSNILSFPFEGYTLALDFPMTRGLLKFLDELDEIIIDYGGRLYLTKDARMSETIFKKGYDHAEEFIELKRKFDPDNRFRSLQSIRVGL